MTKPPDEATLREAALAHLARFAATEAGLLRVLRRRVQRWVARARADAVDAETIAEQRQLALAAVSDVVQRLTAAGAVDDGAFAASRAARLSRSGRSRRVIAAHLAARGVDRETTALALEGEGIDEFGAAVLFARRRRAGPFRPVSPAASAADERGHDLATFARAGFSRAIATRVLGLSKEEAADAVDRLRQM
jgi:regulatory protein